LLFDYRGRGEGGIRGGRTIMQGDVVVFGGVRRGEG
jgi:hypothetical protein